MIHSFTIVSTLPGSLSNVVANTLDVEHLPFHRTLDGARILAETDRTACGVARTKFLFWTISSFHYFELRPPDGFLIIGTTPFGLLRMAYRHNELEAGTPRVHCERIVDVEIDLPRLLYPFRSFIERMLRRASGRLNPEDTVILERRTRLFGDYVEDYLRDGQYLMCKEEFRRHFSRRRPAASPSAKKGEPPLAPSLD